jgi:predicted TIM-barrel fold metal-dependent hydrolase
MNNSNISRREFNSRLAKIGAGVLSASVAPSLLSGKENRSFKGNYIDAHHHLDRDFLTSREKFTLAPMIDWMDRNSVSQTVVLALIQYPENHLPGQSDSIFSSDEIFEKFAATNGRILPFCVVHPDACDSTAEIVKILQRFKEKGAIGFGELKPRDAQGKSMKMALDDKRLVRIYEACAVVGFPVVIHIDGSFAVDVPGLPALEGLLKKFPAVNFVGHATGWWNSISGDVKDFKGYPTGKITPGGAAVRLLQQYPNMYADLSANSGLNAITRDPEVGRKYLVDHSHKLLFGTDIFGGPSNESHAHFDFFDDIDLPEDVKGRIFRENARALFKLDSILPR